jgi:hypothetical protein
MQAHRRVLFEVEGRQSGRQSVPAGQYASLAWVLKLLGAEAIIETATPSRTGLASPSSI